LNRILQPQMGKEKILL